MGKLVSLFLMVFLFVGIGNVWGQEIAISRADNIIENYFGEEDYLKADSLYEAGMIPDALSLYESTLHNLKEKKEWDGFIDVTYKLGKYNNQIRNFEVAITSVNESLKIIDKEAPVLKKKCAKLYQVLSNAYYDSIQMEESLVFTLKRIDLLKANNHTLESFEFGTAYNALGNIHSTMNNYEKAEVAFLEALRISLESTDCPRCVELTGNVYTNLGNVYRKSQKLEKGIEYIEKGVKMASAFYGKNSMNMMSHYYSLAATADALGEYQLAREYFKKALYTLKQNEPYGDYISQMIPYVALDVGFCYLNAEMYEEGKPYFESNLAFYTNGENNPYCAEYLMTLTGLSKISYEQGAQELALSYLMSADTLYEKTTFQSDGVKSDMKSNILLNYAGYYRTIGDYEKSIAAYFEFMHTSGILDNLDILETQKTLNYIAELHLMNNSLDSALYHSHTAIKRGSVNFDTDDYYSLPKLEDIPFSHDFYKSCYLKSVAILKLAATETDAQLKDKSYAHVLAMIDLIDKFHAKNLKKVNLLFRSYSQTLIENSILPYRYGIVACHQRNVLNSNTKNTEQAFFFAQKMKAQQLWLTQLSSEASEYANLSPALLEKERDLRSDISYYEQLAFQAKVNNESALLDSLEGDILLAKREKYTAFLRELDAANPKYFEAKYAFVSEKGSTLQELITPNELLIEYVFADSALFMFTISKNQPMQLHSIPLDKKTMQRIKDYNTSLTNSTMLRPSSREKFINLSHQLYQQFLQPIQDQLVEKKRLIIIGDGVTNYIPFETLLASNEVKPFKALDFLIKNHEISYHYSSTLFAKAKRKAQTDNRGIFAFAPVYDNENTTASVMRSDYVSIDSTLRAVTEDGHFSPLPESENEVNAIIDLFEKANPETTNTLALRQEATEEALKINLEKPYRFAHIAGHSFADLKNPKFSGIACFEEENQDSTALAEDGTLFTGEIYNISSQADLVTLSSCESGFGKLEKTEGLLGLNRAFIYAGTPNVVFSLWKVYDKVSANLMVDFYKNVLEGENYSASLREAKLKLLEKEATAAPHFWSPFLLIGR